jgi:hypothetical protein
MTIDDEIQKGSPVIDRVNAAIRENPLAAGLIGAGLAWMVFGTKGFGVIAGAARDATGKATSAAADAAASVTGGLREATTAATDAAREVASSVGEHAASIVPDINTSELDKATDALNRTGDAVREGVQSAVSSGRQYGQVLQTGLAQSLERQPLLLGAIGLVIGAGIASTFSSTEAERQLLGEKSAAARSALKDAANEVTDRARDVVSEVQQEASRQGLTLDTAKEAASAVAEKVKNVTASVKDQAEKPVASTIR